MLRGSFVPRRHARAPASCHAAALLPRREPGAACHALQAQRGRMESERKTEGERDRERETERARERPIGPPLKPSLGPHWGHPGLLLGPSQRPEGVWGLGFGHPRTPGRGGGRGDDNDDDDDDDDDDDGGDDDDVHGAQGEVSQCKFCLWFMVYVGLTGQRRTSSPQPGQSRALGRGHAPLTCTDLSLSLSKAL